MRTWRVLEWENPPENPVWIPLDCPCGYEACCPTSENAPIIAVKGMSLILDPPDYELPDNYMPAVIQCRKCKRIYSDKE